jgi:hypothetical protein
MRTKTSALSAALFACLFVVLIASACKKDPCETAICQPCPSSRMVFEYQDSLGNCVPSFHATARVYALHSRTADTLYSYNFSDSCHVSFLIADSVVYHLVSTSPAVHDVITLDTWEYQDPLEVTECCLCYPVAHIHGMLNSQALEIEFPTGEYENVAFIRTL